MSTLSMSGEITQNPGDAISESGFSKAREVCSQNPSEDLMASILPDLSGAVSVYNIRSIGPNE